MKFWIGVLIFLLGVGAGLTGVRFIPASVSPYLPGVLQGKQEIVKGEVVRKREKNERLLLTVSTPRGALLATFTQQIDEIDLLVEEGDEVTLGLTQYAPFVRDPLIKGVMKPDHLELQPPANSPANGQIEPSLENGTAPIGPDYESQEPQI